MGTWSNWNDVGGNIISAPSVASRAPERMLVVARGRQNQIVGRPWTEGNSWDNWGEYGGRHTYYPTIISSKPSGYSIYTVGGGQTTYRRIFSGNQWFDWTPTNEGTRVWGGVAAVSVGGTDANEGRIDLFGLNDTNNIIQATYPGGSSKWGPYSSRGGTMQGRMDAASWAPGRVDLVARGASSNKLWHRVLAGNTWGNWREIHPKVISGPAVCTWGPDRLDVFAKGNDHNLIHSFWNGQAWSEWFDLGVFGTDDAPAAVSRTRGNIELFARGRDNKLWHRTYTADPDETTDNGGVADAD